MDTRGKQITPRSAANQLAQYLERNGCIRFPDAERRQELKASYKKGYEVRLSAHDPDELDTMRELLSIVGLKPGQPYNKVGLIVQPIYGKEAADSFRKWLTSLRSKNIKKSMKENG